MKTNTEVHTS